ncbi:MAG: cysteine desulfurase [Magnetococcus sp. YQC-5]
MIYLDHNASSPLRPGILDVVLSVMAQQVGNPASVHWAGRMARQYLDEARRHVAALLDLHESRIVFTSGGTEANNLALFGLAAAKGYQGELLTSQVEHPSILQACEVLAHQGMTVKYLRVDGAGRVDPGEVASALTRQTVLVSIMAANNETGVLQPIHDIGAICQAAGVPFLVDATQWVGKIPLHPDSVPADLVTLSAHKFGGPKGVGALIITPSLLLEPRMLGGGQERGRRAGTENLSGIAGFGAAAALIKTTLIHEQSSVTALRERLESQLLAAVPDAVLWGVQAERLPNTTAVGIPGLDGETLVMTLDLAGFAISSGSACSSGKTTPSHVLRAMGVDPALSQSAVRITLGWNSTSHDVDSFVNAFYRSVNRLRKGS